MWAKQKILHGGGPSNLNVGIFACSFEVRWATQPFPFINYVLQYHSLTVTKSFDSAQFSEFSHAELCPFKCNMQCMKNAFFKTL